MKFQPGKGDSVLQRAQEIFDARRKAVFIATDRLLAKLLLVQWVAAVAAALWFSPRTWIGERSHIHLHVWVAIVLGYLISVLPLMLVVRRPGETITRYVVSTAQLLMSSLLIHLMDGRIEAHFHIFGSLAFITFYRDWRVLIPASAVTMLDHLLRGYFWPESIYGAAFVSEWRWLEHSLWVLFTDIFLFISCQRGRQKEWNYAEKQADLEELNDHVEQIDPVDFRLRDEMESLCNIMLPQAQQKNLAFFWQVSPDAPDAIVGDALKLRRILHYVIGNAIKFTHEGEIKVFVTSEKTMQSTGVQLQFTVHDTGIGIPPEKQQRIFEAFTQADGSLSRMYGGMGLGLSLANNLVKLMGGKLWLESEVGRGSTFHFTANFPISEKANNEKDTVTLSEKNMAQMISGGNPVHDDRSPKASVQTTEGPAIALTQPPQKRTGGRILLVEDNLINQKLAVRLLEKKNYTVVIANNGAEAVDVLSRENFDLILMDVQMPVMNGLEATIKIREREKFTGGHIPILAVTANAMQGDRELCLDAGMNDYITKPIRSKELYRLIDLYSSSAADKSDENQNALEKNISQFPANSLAQENRLNI